jgi:hypothetical protein
LPELTTIVAAQQPAVSSGEIGADTCQPARGLEAMLQMLKQQCGDYLTRENIVKQPLA